MPSLKRWSLVSGLWSLVFVLLSLVPGPWSSTSHASEFFFNPSIAVSEEYNDNVFETNDRRSDYITRLLPGIALRYSAPFWDWDLAYNYDYRIYAQRSRENDDAHNLATRGLLKLIDDFLLLDISDTYRKVSLNIARDRTQESLFLNQTDSNTLAASPYIQFHPVPQTTVRSGYRYTNVWYQDPTAIDRRQHGGYIDTTYELSPGLNLSANYTYTHENSINPFDRHAPYAGFRYDYKDRSLLFVYAGYTWLNSKDGGVDNYPFWNAGITHAFNTWSVFLRTGVLYPEDPRSGVTRETDYSLGVNKDLNRGTVGASLYYANYKGTNVGLINNIPGSERDISNKYGAGITAKYELTTKLTGNLAGSIERYDHRTTNSYIRRIHVNPSLIYALPRDFAVALNYVFVDSYSPVTEADRYQANRVSLELRKTFGKMPEGPRPWDGDRGPGTMDPRPVTSDQRSVTGDRRVADSN